MNLKFDFIPTIFPRKNLRNARLANTLNVVTAAGGFAIEATTPGSPGAIRMEFATWMAGRLKVEYLLRKSIGIV